MRPKEVNKCIRNRELIRAAKKKHREFSHIADKTWSDIINDVHLELIEEFMKNGSVKFPCRLGEIRLVKHHYEPYINKNNKVKGLGLINWHSTMKLWEEDEECAKKKVVVRYNKKDLCFIRYIKNSRTFSTKKFYTFIFSKALRQRVMRTDINDLIYYYEQPKRFRYNRKYSG